MHPSSLVFVLIYYEFPYYLVVVDDQFHLRVDSNNPSGCQPTAIKELDLDSRNMEIDFEAFTRSVDHEDMHPSS